MDPLAHTLVGASLAEAGLRRNTPLATATLVVGANLPDVDALLWGMGSDHSLLMRRGWTHGVLAMAVLPILLTGAVLLYDRLVRRRRAPDRAPARAGAVFGLALLSVLSHPLLDWLNTYGVRLLMPFDGRWFYGDVLFIMDPWIWLLAGTAVVLSRARSGVSVAGWIALWSAALGAFSLAFPSPLAVKVAVGAGLAGIVALGARRKVARRRLPGVARVALSAAVLYTAAMFVGGRLTEVSVTAWLRGRGIQTDSVVAAPLAGNPFVRDVIAVAPQRYYFVHADWLAREPFHLSRENPRRGEPGPVARAALESPRIQGFINWMRFPAYQVSETSSGYRVTIRDQRYARMKRARIGTVTVDLDRSLRPR